MNERASMISEHPVSQMTYSSQRLTMLYLLGFLQVTSSSRSTLTARSAQVLLEVSVAADTLLTPELQAQMPIQTAPGVQVLGNVAPDQVEILSVEAQRFVATLHRCFNTRRKELLHRRVMRQYEIDAGNLPGSSTCPYRCCNVFA